MSHAARKNNVARVQVVDLKLRATVEDLIHQSVSGSKIR